MNLSIIPNRLAVARQHRGIEIDDLAIWANLPAGRIKALEEADKPTKVSPSEMIRLAESLRLDSEVLAGEREMPDDAERYRKQAVSVNLSGQARRDCELVRMRYGVSREELMEMAPLMFTLVAEDILRWRRERLKRARQVMRDFDYAQNLMGLRFKVRPLERGPNDELPGTADQEEASIASRDVFGKQLSGPRGLKLRAPEVFPSYLMDRMRDSDFDGAIALWDEDLGCEEDESAWGGSMHWPGDCLPVHRLLPDQVYELVGLGPEGSPSRDQLEALIALNHCRIELADLPEELMAEDKAAERVAWINHHAVKPAA